MDNKEKRNIPDIVLKPDNKTSVAVSDVESDKSNAHPKKELTADERIRQHKAAIDKMFEEIASENKSDNDVSTDNSLHKTKTSVKKPHTDESDSKKEKLKKEEKSSDTDTKPGSTAEKLEFHNNYSKPTSSKKKNKSKKKKKLRFNVSIVGGLTLTIVIVTMSIVFATGAITLGMEYLGINKSDNEIKLNIPEGSNNDEIADILVENNIIENKNLFKIALKIVKPEALYPGDITLSPNTSYPNIIENLSMMRESYETVTVTIPEGATLLQVAKKLEKNGVCSANDFLFQFNASQDFELDNTVTHNDDVYYAMEGYFFPDTYEFYVDDSAYNVTKIVREHFESKITSDMYKRMEVLGMDLNEVITLASIVQTEAGTTEDMPLVASVFINRLNDPDTFPSLQSDATKNYIKKVIKKAETSTTMIDHYTNCYDTYICMGLPAGPVCNPGIDAINAVLYPEDTDYYYFCNNLETGKSYFAETYKQHQKNLKKAGLSE